MENIKSMEVQEANESEKFEQPVKTFLADYFESLRASQRTGYDNVDVQFDGGDPESFGMLQSGDYEITEFVMTPDARSAKSAFHFNVGRLKIHLTGKAAVRIHEMVGE